jgi:hypothetical protein
MATKINLLSKQTKPNLLQRVVEALPFGKKPPPLPTRGGGGGSAREPGTLPEQVSRMAPLKTGDRIAAGPENLKLGHVGGVPSAGWGPGAGVGGGKASTEVSMPGLGRAQGSTANAGVSPSAATKEQGIVEYKGPPGSPKGPKSSADQFTPTGGMAGAGGWLEAGGGLGTAATAGIGGVAAFATGDWTDVPRGALTGATLGFGARYAARGFPGFAKNISKQYPEAFGAATLGKAGEMVSTYGADRHAMFAGAALGGAVFGHRKKNHSRGFNQTRGSRI